VLSVSPKEVSNKVRGKNIRARKLDKFEEQISHIEFTECPARLAYEDMSGKDVDDLVAVSDG